MPAMPAMNDRRSSGCECRRTTPEAEGPEAVCPMSKLGCAYAAAGQQNAALQMVEELLAPTYQSVARFGLLRRILRQLLSATLQPSLK